ncbi:MAG: TolC family protein [Ignavibacteria bacterium]|nr:TolC family protein [Ignavibacteria bacterium]
MNKIKIFIITGLVFLAASSGFSQTRVITLPEAVTLAKSYNSELTIARLDESKANEYVSQVYSENLLPNLTLNSRYTRNIKRQVLSFAGQSVFLGTDNAITNTLDLQEPIPVLGTPVFSGITIAKYYSNLASKNTEAKEIKVTSNVKKAYYGVLLSKEVITVNQNSLENAQANLKVVESRYRNGVATEFDYLRAKVRVDNLLPAVSSSQNNLLLSRQNLKLNIGSKTSEDYDAAGSLLYDSLEVFGTTNSLLDRIAKENITVKQLDINRLINEELVTVDKANYLPKLYGFAQYGLAANEDDGRSLGQYRFFNTFNLGLGLSWSLNFFKNDYKVHQSLIEVKKSEEQISDIKSKLRTQAQSVIVRIEDARNRIRSLYETVRLSERGLELADVSFKNGVLNQIDVLDANLQVSQSRLAYLQAIYDYLIARTDLEELMNSKK